MVAGALLAAGEVLGEYTVVALLEQRDGLETYTAVERAGGGEVVLQCRAASAQGVDEAELFGVVEKLVRFRDARVPATFAGGSHAGVVWIAGEMVEGTPLGEVVRARDAIALGVALSHAHELLEVLMAAERHGLRHGSLNSSSVVLCPKLPELRVRGIGVGQAFGRNVRAAADVWGAAAVLYEMLTGFAPENPCVPISRVLRGVPRSLCAVLDRALDSDPRARYESLRDLARALKAVEREPIVQREIQQALERSVTVFGMEPVEDATGEDLDQKRRHQPKARARSRALERARRGRREMPAGGALVAPDDRPPLLTVVGERVGQELADAVEEAAFGEFLFTLIYLGIFPVPPDSEPAAAPSARGDAPGAEERTEPPVREIEVQPAPAPLIPIPSLAPSSPAGPSTLRSRVPQPPIEAERKEPRKREKRLLRPEVKRRLGRGLASVALVVAALIFLRDTPPLRVEPQQALCVDLGRTASFPLQDLAPVPVAPPPPPTPPPSITPRPRPAPLPARRKPTKAPQKAEPDPVRDQAYVLDDDGTESRRSQ
jgi:hypothetical protein